MRAKYTKEFYLTSPVIITTDQHKSQITDNKKPGKPGFLLAHQIKPNGFILLLEFQLLVLLLAHQILMQQLALRLSQQLARQRLSLDGHALLQA